MQLRYEKPLYTWLRSGHETTSAWGRLHYPSGEWALGNVHDIYGLRPALHTADCYLVIEILAFRIVPNRSIKCEGAFVQPTAKSDGEFPPDRIVTVYAFTIPACIGGRVSFLLLDGLG